MLVVVHCASGKVPKKKTGLQIRKQLLSQMYEI